MGQKNCMNELCRGTTSSEWKNGWALKSGGFATLCSDCGSAYANSVFCEAFHQKESGWRECRMCLKCIHCGCIASRHVYEHMDSGGVSCISCAKHSEICPMQPMQIPSDIPNCKFVTNGIRDIPPIAVENTISTEICKQRPLQLTNAAIKVDDVASELEQVKHEEPTPKFQESRVCVPQLSLQCSSSVFVPVDNSTPKPVVKNISDPNEGSSQHRQSTQNTSPNLQKPNSIAGLGMNKGAVSQKPVPRPPADGRGRNQLLPRYWPRISDQELQQLSGNLKSNIVPLFEKILSASDAGRIGRLVLPKACAEAYFPTIIHSEGIPIKIQDTTGKEWTFQFRFWPNNNSRMYVLEGITPCIQNMQLQAGDAVIFSRIDPGGQLLLGCRKAINNVDVQDVPAPGVLNGDKTPIEMSFPRAPGNQLLNGGGGPDGFQQHITALLEKKRTRNIKNKRLLMHNDDAAELRLTWEEAQELFRPPLSSEPTIVMIEGHEFEEFEEPPIFGKRTFLITRPSGEQEQLVECDNCSKWRKLPVHARISANWTCSDNIWDSNRCSCSAPESVNPTDPECFGINNDSKRLNISDSKASDEEEPPSGLDALATAAVLGDEIGNLVEFPIGETTRHPRHRPGCTCIVCIQPPSGKGKHVPTCRCNVCLMVKRRFKTLSMRKKKREMERKPFEIFPENDNIPRTNPNENEMYPVLLKQSHNLEKGASHQMQTEVEKKGELDLNCHPNIDDEGLEEAAGASLTALANVITLPLDTYLEHKEPTILEPRLLSQTMAGKEEKNVTQRGGFASSGSGPVTDPREG